ncbi:hypothetical protein Q4E93_04275 [Flavitalea sp. BT771]|uniref:hypothetical protein n=1 Tax=Flavitalea sp. BT771 TaxID=3063329 RepID=UPI0026E3CBBB|nr:hypothetical protein [Flavitalea sp. BT771]MDO6429785.1 hypothetical protein [Flavitalea sp. BT771]MDV6218087.1 hypothetical protein [Flavitalea sp. BT771]
MSQPYHLEKKIWTESDFPIMGWHDAPVYGMTFLSDASALSNQLLFDLDYIFQWITPIPPDNHFSFWIAPATLIFKHVADLNLEINHEPPYTFDFEIRDIYRLEELTYPNGGTYWKWQIELGNGNIYFKASGYEQIIRKPPALTTSQEFPDRGETSFSGTTF